MESFKRLSPEKNQPKGLIYKDLKANLNPITSAEFNNISPEHCIAYYELRDQASHIDLFCAQAEGYESLFVAKIGDYLWCFDTDKKGFIPADLDLELIYEGIPVKNPSSPPEPEEEKKPETEEGENLDREEKPSSWIHRFKAKINSVLKGTVINDLSEDQQTEAVSSPSLASSPKLWEVPNVNDRGEWVGPAGTSPFEIAPQEEENSVPVLKEEPQKGAKREKFIFKGQNEIDRLLVLAEGSWDIKENPLVLTEGRKQKDKIVRISNAKELFPEEEEGALFYMSEEKAGEISGRQIYKVKSGVAYKYKPQLEKNKWHKAGVIKSLLREPERPREVVPTKQYLKIKPVATLQEPDPYVYEEWRRASHSRKMRQSLLNRIEGFSRKASVAALVSLVGFGVFQVLKNKPQESILSSAPLAEGVSKTHLDKSKPVQALASEGASHFEPQATRETKSVLLSGEKERKEEKKEEATLVKESVEQPPQPELTAVIPASRNTDSEIAQVFRGDRYDVGVRDNSYLPNIYRPLSRSQIKSAEPLEPEYPKARMLTPEEEREALAYLEDSEVYPKAISVDENDLLSVDAYEGVLPRLGEVGEAVPNFLSEEIPPLEPAGASGEEGVLKETQRSSERKNYIVQEIKSLRVALDACNRSIQIHEEWENLPRWKRAFKKTPKTENQIEFVRRSKGEYERDLRAFEQELQNL